MSWRYGAALMVVAVLAFIFALWGSRGIGTIAVISAPLVIAALATGLTRRRFPDAIFIGAGVGLLPAVGLALAYEMFGDPPSESIVRTREGGALLILILFGIPCAVAGVVGGSIGALVGHHGQQTAG